MKDTLINWFWPHPVAWYYQDPKVKALIAVGVALIVLSFIIRLWRARTKNPQVKTLTKSWAAMLLWFGIVALFLVVCRAEEIQFLAMRALWVVWLLLLMLYSSFQLLAFRRKYYAVLGRATVHDEREKYLPGRR